LSRPWAGYALRRVVGLTSTGEEWQAGGVTAEKLKAKCLEMHGAEETFPFTPGVSVFKVAGKIFAIAPLDDEPLRVSVKCDPELGEQLRTAHDSIVPGYHLNKRHWVTVTLGQDAPDELVAQLIEDSYDLVKAGAVRSARRA
jgi:predicted DNA-binding protein (MmcQ/YjbR family)